MKNEIKKYIKKNLVVFSINVNQEEHKSGKWKKRIDFPAKWSNFTIDNTIINEKQNGLALLTGKINNIIIIDIDNIDHWKQLLVENNQKEPNTVKVISGSGGAHYYFKYTEDLSKITSKDHCFGKDYDIDVKTNGGCIIIPPTKYFNKNLNKDVAYTWEKNIFDHEPIEMPKWIKNLLEEKKIKKIQKEPKEEQKEEYKIDTEDTNINFKSDDIELLVDMLSIDRCDCYNDWISIGMCLFNLDKTYLYIWRKWSKQSDKYENGQCESKWKSFKKSKDGFQIGQLVNLRDFSCHENQISKIPKEIGQLINLRTFSGSSNKISEIPIEITRCMHLDTFYYSNNAIEYIPPQVRRFFDMRRFVQKVYNDTQSVHNHNIQTGIFNSISYIMQKKPLLTPENLKTNILNNNILEQKTKEIIFEYIEDKSVHSILNITFEELLISVYDFILNHEHQEELFKILDKEMNDSICKCFTGRISRLINTLNGFDDNIKIQISDAEQIGNICVIIKQKLEDTGKYSDELFKKLIEEELLKRNYERAIIEEWLENI